MPRNLVAPGDRVCLEPDGSLLLEVSLVRGEFLDCRYGELLLGRLNLFLPTGAEVLLNGRAVEPSALPRSRAALARFDSGTGRVGRLEVVDPSPGGPGGPPWSVAAGLRPSDATPERPLRAGETLHLAMRAPAGGVASWDLAGVAWGLPGREVSPGLYRGTFRVPAGLDARRTFVLGRYRSGGVDRPVRVGPCVSLAPSPPRLLEGGPRGLAGARPALFARYESPGADVEASRVRLELDGRDVTRPARRTGELVFYEPPAALSPGRHRVRLVVPDTAGNRASWTWSFEVAAGATAVPGP